MIKQQWAGPQSQLLFSIVSFGDYFNIQIKASTINRVLDAFYLILNLPTIIFFVLPLLIFTNYQKNKVTSVTTLNIFKFLSLFFIFGNFFFIPIIIFYFFYTINLFLGIILALLFFIFYVFLIFQKNKISKQTYLEVIKESQEDIDYIIKNEKDFNVQRIKVEALLTIKKFFESTANRKTSIIGFIAVLFLKSKVKSKSSLNVIEKETNQALQLMSLE